MSSTPTPSPAAGRLEPLYPRAAWYFAAATAITVAGFARSYFGRLGTTDALHHFHGIAATLWMFLLIAQAHLAASRQLKAHRLLGRLSLVVAPALVVSGLLVVREMLAGRNGFNQAFGARLAWIDVNTVLYFAVAYALAIHHRRNQPLHARWLASTAVVVLPPGLARFLGNYVPGISSFEASVYLTYLICLVIAVALILDDRRKGGVRLPYLALAISLAVQVAGFAWAASWAWWNAAAHALAAS
jgi:hypothetical protein